MSGPVVVQHDVGRSRRDLAVALVGALLVAGFLVAAVAGQRSPGVVVVGVIGIVLVAVGLPPWLRWHGLQVRLDETGVLFGAPTARARPPLFSGLMRQPFHVAWDGFGDAHLVEGRDAGARMQQLMAPARVTTANGFFPRSGAPAHVSLLVIDPSRTPIPWQRTLRSGTFTMHATPDPMNPSRRWVFPVRDGAAVVAAFQAWGKTIEQTDAPAAPAPCPEWAAPGTPPTP